MSERSHLDLFSGIGGFSIAAGWAGFKTIAFCEIDEYAQRVLIKNFGAIMADAAGELSGPRRSERPEAREETANDSPRIFQDIRQLDGTQFKGVDLLTAGVPCQPASCAGKRRGKEDDRWLWPEALRILREAAPDFAVFENPPGILSLESGVEFEHLLSEMESYGYSVQPIIVPACAVDARHRRDRIWIVAHADRRRLCGQRICEKQPERAKVVSTGETLADSKGKRSGAGLRQTGSERNRREPENGSDDADAQRSGLEIEQQQSDGGKCTPAERNSHQWSGRKLEPGLGVLADGLPAGLAGPARWPDEDPQVPRTAKAVKYRVAKLRCLGNSIVPAVAYQILKLLLQSAERTAAEGVGK